MNGDDEAFNKILAYAARDSFKTLACSVLEILCIFHLRRSVAHMAAIEPQAQKCIQYINKAFRRPYLSDFLISNNKRTIEICKYEDSKGNVLSPREFEALGTSEKLDFEAKNYYIKVIIATMSGANSEHCPIIFLDELDLAPPKPVEEAMMIPSQGENGELPITFMTSSRKFAFGLVQKTIDEAVDERGNVVTHLRHWNLLDVTESCPAKRHLPELPKIPIYINDDTLDSINQEAYDNLPEEEKDKFVQNEGYQGCLKNCSLFAMCKGRLATKQKSTSKMLKKVATTASVFKRVSIETAKAQLLCRKPSGEGLIYPHFSDHRNMKTAREMAEILTGIKIPEIVHFTKQELVQLFQRRNVQFHSGMDFGYTHMFAVVTGAVDGVRLFIFDYIEEPGLEVNEKIEVTRPLLKLDPSFYPDPASPADIKSFRKAGFRCKHFIKDVVGGINSVRSKIYPGMNREPELFLLKGDPGCELLAKRIKAYHWIIDEDGTVTDKPDETDDDGCDALRYLCQCVFGTRTNFAVATGNSPVLSNRSDNRPLVNDQNWLSNKIRELTKDGSEPVSFKGKKGQFFFDL